VRRRSTIFAWPNLAAQARGGGADVFVAGVEVGAVVEEEGGVFEVAFAGELVEGGDAEPVGIVGIHAVGEGGAARFEAGRGFVPRPTGADVRGPFWLDCQGADSRLRAVLSTERIVDVGDR
jgi:hypothetical protein